MNTPLLVNYKEALKLNTDFSELPLPKRSMVKQKRIYDLVSFARKNSNYYSKCYESLPNNFFLSDLPISSRDGILKSFDSFCCDNNATKSLLNEYLSQPQAGLFLDSYYAVSSCGTLGKPVITLYDTSAMSIISAIFSQRILSQSERSFSVFGEKIAAVFSNGPFFPCSILNFRKNTQIDKGKNILLLSSYDDTEYIVKELNKYKPSVLIGYTSALVKLMNLKKDGQLKINPSLIISAGELLSFKNRCLLEEIFKCNVREIYYSAEGGLMAYECSHHHMHINEDWCILESVDEKLQPVPNGTSGTSTLVTNLTNFITPIIRYELWDKIKIHSQECACGNPSPWIEFVGNSTDNVYFSYDKKNIILPVHELSRLFTAIPEILNFQVLIYPNNCFGLRLIPQNGVDKYILFFKVEKILREYLKNLGILSSAITLEKEPPGPDPFSGKFSTILFE